MNADDFAASGLHVMTKPIGPICNLDCEYCYYLHKEQLYDSHERWRMSEAALENFVRQYIAAQPEGSKSVTFAWQGGEPTLLGLEFFERVVQLQQQYAVPDMTVENAFQTNGVLLDEDWCRFLVQHRFLVGLSMDGPAEFHDRYRYDKKGQPTFRATLAAMKLLREHDVEFNVMVCVNRHNGDHGKRVYTYLRDAGARFLQLIPIVEPRGAGQHPEENLAASDEHPLDHLVSSRSVRPEQFGRFLIEIFDTWLRRDVGRVFVQTFDQALSAWAGIEPSLCVFRRTCGRALALEHNGDVYSCDHFVEPAWLLGNIADASLADLANSPAQLEFANAKSDTLPQYCRDCEVRFVCNGECPKNRFATTPDGDPGLNYLCAGYRAFFNHIDPVMRKMAVAIKSGRPAAEAVTGATAAVAGSVGRNTPCPCGSGRKFKKCCGAV